MDITAAIELIKEERERQKLLPGSEFDLTNGPNDWTAIAAKYLSESARCHGVAPHSDEFQNSLVKAAAVIFAAMDHIEHMEKNKKLR